MGHAGLMGKQTAPLDPREMMISVKFQKMANRICFPAFALKYVEIVR